MPLQQFIYFLKLIHSIKNEYGYGVPTIFIENSYTLVASGQFWSLKLMLKLKHI